jgi:hypothetical protein
VRLQWYFRAIAVLDLCAGKRTKAKFRCHHLSSRITPIFLVASAEYAEAKAGTVSPVFAHF